MKPRVLAISRYVRGTGSNLVQLAPQFYLPRNASVLSRLPKVGVPGFCADRTLRHFFSHLLTASAGYIGRGDPDKHTAAWYPVGDSALPLYWPKGAE